MDTFEDTIVTTTEPKSEHVHHYGRDTGIVGTLALLALLAALGVHEYSKGKAKEDLDGLTPTPAHARLIEEHLLGALTDAESMEAVEKLRKIGGGTALKAYIASIKSVRKPDAKMITAEVTAAVTIAETDPTQRPTAELLFSLLARDIVDKRILLSRDRREISVMLVRDSFEFGDLGIGNYLANNAAQDTQAAIAPDLAAQRQQPSDYRQISGKITKFTYAPMHLK